MSDNIRLKYMFDQQNLNTRHARCLAFLSEYDFEIKHIKGKETKVADSLRRNAVTSFVASISSYKTNLEDIYGRSTTTYGSKFPQNFSMKQLKIMFL